MRETLRNLWKRVIDFFSSDDKQEQATPTTQPVSTQQTTPTNIQQPTWLNTTWTVIWNPTNTSTLNETIERQRRDSKTDDSDNITNTPINTTNYFDISTVDNNKINAVLDKREKESKEHWWETLWRWWNTLATTVSNIVNWQTADSESQAKEEKVYIGYNKDNWDMYELTLNTDNVYWAQDKFYNAYNNFITNVNKYWDNITQEQFGKEYDDFYNQVSWLFQAKWDDWYSDWIIFSWDWANRIWRRKDTFSEEQLNTLAQSWIDSTRNYVPTKEQLMGYIDAMEKNNTTNKQIQIKYNLKEDPLQLDNSITWRAQEKFLNRAMLWVLDIAKENLKWWAIQHYPIRAAEVVENEFDRAWEYAEPLLEEAELIKLEAQRQWRELTEEEKLWIEQANKIEWMLDAFADWLNYYFKDNASSDWVDSNWNITWVKDVYSDWRDLWWVISKWVIDKSWLDEWQNFSWLDAFQEVANNWRYHLSNSRSWAIWKAWNKFDRAVWKAWTFLSEVWQQTVWNLLRMWNMYKDIATFDYSNLKNRLQWNASMSQLAEFINQDFTIWKMITTKETWLSADVFWQTWSRTIRKYLLQASEYWPEFVGNVIPDILLYSTWIWEAWTVTSAARWANKLKQLWAVEKAAKTLESVNLLKKARGVGEWTKAAAEAIQQSADAPSWIKVWLQWLDKWLTNWIVDQTIDAQYSWYDTESYSTPSMALSLWGTIWFEIIPWLYKSWVLRMWRNMVSWKNALDWTAWDVLDFFSNQNNADAINRIANINFNKSPSWLTFDDFRKLNDSFQEMKQVTKEYWDRLPPDMKIWVNKWTKQNAYNMLTQVYNLDSNSQIARNVRAMISKDWTNLADIAKYLWWIPWDVEVWPWVSTIKLKNTAWQSESKVWVSWVWATPYDAQLDISLEWWLASKLEDWFTKQDINTISSMPRYKDLTEEMFTLWEDGKYYITENWLKEMWIQTKDMPLSWAARELNKAEIPEISNKFKEIMKELRTSNKQISNETIDLVANSQTYQDVRDKVADVVC